MGISGNVIWSRNRGLVVNMYTNWRCWQYYNTWPNWSWKP